MSKTLMQLETELAYLEELVAAKKKELALFRTAEEMAKHDTVFVEVIKTLWSTGSRAAAVLRYRDAYGTTLLDAKLAVERIVGKNL